jgi:hypothetical protein
LHADYLDVCLAVGDESVCAELQTSGGFCVLDARQNTTDSSDGQQSTYLGVCPCAAGLICSSAVSSSEESGVSPIFDMFGVCKAAEPETDEGEQAE